MARESSCLANVAKGAGLGAAIGASFGAVMGIGEAVIYKGPALMKLRLMGQRTVGTSVLFGLFLGVGSALHCGRS